MVTKLDDSFYKELGKLLRAARENKGLSLDNLSLALKGERSKSSLKRYEDGEARITIELLNKISNVLEVDANTLIARAEVLSDFSEIPILEDYEQLDTFMRYQDSTKSTITRIGRTLDTMSKEQQEDFLNDFEDFVKIVSRKK